MLTITLFEIDNLDTINIEAERTGKFTLNCIEGDPFGASVKIRLTAAMLQSIADMANAMLGVSSESTKTKVAMFHR